MHPPKRSRKEVLTQIAHGHHHIRCHGTADGRHANVKGGDGGTSNSDVVRKNTAGPAVFD